MTAAMLSACQFQSKSVEEYQGVLWAARVEPRSNVRRPLVLSPTDRFICRCDASFRCFSPAFSTLLLPASSRLEFRRGLGVLQVGLPSLSASNRNGYLALSHDEGCLWFDRLRSRPWRTVAPSPNSLEKFFHSVCVETWASTDALVGLSLVNHPQLLLLKGTDVLDPPAKGTEEPITWFSIDWPEGDMAAAVVDLQRRVHINGALMTDRLTSTVFCSMLAQDCCGRSVITASPELPPEQQVRILSVTHGGQRFRSRNELGDWRAPVYRLDPGDNAGDLALLRLPQPSASTVVRMVRFPSEPWDESISQRKNCEPVNDEGIASRVELLTQLSLPFPVDTFQIIQQVGHVLRSYPHYELGNWMADEPHCGELVWQASAKGLKAVCPTTIFLRRQHPMSSNDLKFLESELNCHLTRLLQHRHVYRVRFEEIEDA